MRNKVCAVVFGVALFFVSVAGNAQASRHVVVHAGHLLDVKTGKMRG